MEYRPLGSTGLKVSLLGFGAMRIPDRPQDEVGELLRRALALGVNYIDTAPGYGNSEELIGSALEGVDTTGVVFSTKTHVGSDRTADAVRERVERSLERMRLQRLQVLQMWGINTWEMAQHVLTPEGPLAGARRLQQEGLVGHVGFTTHAPPEVAIRVLETGEFCSVTGRFHYLDPVYQPLREKAHEMGLGFIAMTPLGQGWLARPSAALQSALSEHDPVDFALRWIAAHRGVSTAIVGLATVSELEAAHAAIGGELGDGGPLVEHADRLLAHVAEALGPEHCTGCGECLPCPEDINIPELLRLNGLLRVYGLEEWCRDRYKFMGNAGTWYPGTKADHCTRCGLCEPRCPEGVPIVRLLEALHRDLFAGDRGRLSKED